VTHAGRPGIALVLTFACVLAVGCDGPERSAGPYPLEAGEIADHEGAVCGMLVRGQSAPRAQVIHRDGEHSFLCSIGDLLAYLEVPSPHGAAERVFVEVMDPTEDPLESHTAPHPWIPAEDAVYLVGILRRGIMGPPVLVYRSRAEAEQVAAASSARLLDFDGLREWWRQRGSEEPTKAVLSGQSMGTTWSVIASLPDDTLHELEAGQRVVEERLQTVERLMSNWDRDSELSRFNRHASTAPFRLSPETLEVLSLARQVSEKTAGAFDVTVGPLVSAWGFGAGARAQTRRPGAVEIAKLRERVGFRFLGLSPSESTAHKRRADVVCDLSGIAKGFAVDAAARALTELGWTDFVIELGGDVRASGRRTDGEIWRVGVERPDAGGRIVHAVVDLADRAMATSGDYRSFRIESNEAGEDVRLSHIIDPRTGRPVSHALASVSVVREDAALADAWATALLVLGLERGRELADAEGIGAFFITRTGGDTFAAEATRQFPDVQLPSTRTTYLTPVASTAR
jgi:thiamine biosynthesis lipoprotein